MTLLALAIKCSKCGARPNRRIFPATKDMYRHRDDNEPVDTWRCGCGEVNVITAAAYKGAA